MDFFSQAFHELEIAWKTYGRFIGNLKSMKSSLEGCRIGIVLPTQLTWFRLGLGSAVLGIPTKEQQVKRDHMRVMVGICLLYC